MSLPDKAAVRHRGNNSSPDGARRIVYVPAGQPLCPVPGDPGGGLLQRLVGEQPVPGVHPGELRGGLRRGSVVWTSAVVRAPYR